MSNGLYTGDSGFIVNQTQLLQDVIDGLAVYNSTLDPLVDLLSMEILKEQARIPQAPLDFEEEGQGTNPAFKNVQKRLLTFPLRTFDTATAWTKTGLEDALPSDIMADANAAMQGDAQRVLGLMMAAAFKPQPAGSVSTAYRAGAYNGETDVPSFGEKQFTTAHYHYKGINTTTLARSHILEAVEDIAEHGYGGPYVAVFSTYQADEVLGLQDPTTGVLAATPERQLAVDQGVISRGTTIAGVFCKFSMFVPAGYFGVFDTSVKPLGRREHINPAYRGLRMEESMNDALNPLYGKYFRRRIGFAGRHLGAFTLRQIVASTSYTDPTMRFQ